MGRVIPSWQNLVADLGPRRAGRKVVFTNGCFDLLHVGHIRYLQEARSLGDLLVIGLNTDASVQKLKGPDRPLQDQNSRAEIMAALACVDYVTFFDEETPAKLIETVRPDILVKGGDYQVSTIVGASFVQSYGGEVRPLQFAPGYSTSAIVEKIRRG
jgi:rfaE bifunctional protein nucleotidyltransferase chain/domain